MKYPRIRDISLSMLLLLVAAAGTLGIAEASYVCTDESAGTLSHNSATAFDYPRSGEDICPDEAEIVSATPFTYIYDLAAKELMSTQVAPVSDEECIDAVIIFHLVGCDMEYSVYNVKKGNSLYFSSEGTGGDYAILPPCYRQTNVTIDDTVVEATPEPYEYFLDIDEDESLYTFSYYMPLFLPADCVKGYKNESITVTHIEYHSE